MPKRPLVSGSSSDGAAYAPVAAAAAGGSTAGAEKVPPSSIAVKQEKSSAVPVVKVEVEGVTDPGLNDVISGRGDTINRHPGNVHFRKLVEEKRRVYLSSHFKREKRLIAETIVAAIKAMDPPGRFLSKDPKSGLWFPIDEDRAREKASQALRENSKKIKAELQQSDDSIRKHTSINVQGHQHAHQHQQNCPPTGAGTSAGARAAGATTMPCSNANSGALATYDAQAHQQHQHHYPYPPSGPGWGYPYYYGYQMPPLPGFHPHAYPPLPPHLSSCTGPTYYPYAPPPHTSTSAASAAAAAAAAPPSEATTNAASTIADQTAVTTFDDNRLSRPPFNHQPMPEQRLSVRQSQLQQRQTQEETQETEADSQSQQRQGYASGLKCRKVEAFHDSHHERDDPPNTNMSKSATSTCSTSSIVHDSVPLTPPKHKFQDPASPHQSRRQMEYTYTACTSALGHLHSPPPPNYGGSPPGRARIMDHDSYRRLEVHTGPAPPPPSQYHRPPEARTPGGPKTPVAAIQDIVFHASQGAGLHHPFSATPSFSRSPLPANSPATDQSVPFSPIRAQQQQQLLENQNHPAKLPNDFSVPTSSTHTPRRFHRHALAQRSNYFV